VTEAATAPARMGDVGRAFVRAGSRFELVAVVLGAMIGALLSVSLGLLLATSPFSNAWRSWPLPWLSLSDAFLVMALIVCWQAAGILVLDRRLRRAEEAHIWMAERDLATWQRATGSRWWSLPPTTPRGAERWLQAHPLNETNAYARAEVMLLAERFEEAAAALAELVPRSDAERMARADLLATLRLLANGDADLEELRRAAAAASGDDRLAAHGVLAVIEARLALQTGGDWLRPFEAVRDDLGARANGILWRRLLPRRLLAAAPAAVLILLAFGLLHLLASTTAA
jgi:hypothetical protein